MIEDRISKVVEAMNDYIQSGIGGEDAHAALLRFHVAVRAQFLEHGKGVRQLCADYLVASLDVNAIFRDALAKALYQSQGNVINVEVK